RDATTKDAEFEDRAIEFSRELIEQSERFRKAAGGGLVPIEIEMDDAMMTALVQRFDLMNQRGILADNWRLIKYAADDLRSVLNLNATQSIRTSPVQNQPFDFNFDDSRTTVGLTLDLPFNRRAQRNRFRSSLFTYQRTLRNVMQLEDNIKLSIRRDLRALKLNGRQYENDVAGAALASERVTGTELEVRGGFATSRDFLESQQAYVQAISGVASDHVNYIVGRLGLFLDLESLTVDDNGFWDKLYDENYQPIPELQLPGYARPGYGELHPKLKYSWRIQRMRCVPDGVSMIHEHQQPDQPIDPELDAETTVPVE
ncbi:MAG: TolC family protein, partial [Planctomycetales bacterium]|nr:TolC family protein [Planctomycetales bacterium]